MKDFGGNTRKPVREEFGLTYTNDEGESQRFEGQVAARSDGSGFVRMMRALSGDGSALGDVLFSLLLKHMDDKDGAVNAKWELKELPPPADLDDDELEEWQPCYRGPDGVLYEMRDEVTRAKWEDRTTWSTRRRWRELMLDENAIVGLDDLMDIAEWVMSLVGKGATRQRA